MVSQGTKDSVHNMESGQTGILWIREQRQYLSYLQKMTWPCAISDEVNVGVQPCMKSKGIASRRLDRLSIGWITMATQW